jgi:signal peptidase I
VADERQALPKARNPDQPCRVPSGAMLPTLRLGQLVTVSADAAYAPCIGDIVLFYAPAGADSGAPVCGNPRQGAGHPEACSSPTPDRSPGTWIKRIVAGPGDQFQMRDGHVIRNGEEQEEPCVLPRDTALPSDPLPDPSCNFPAPITIPPGHYFVLGDNRGQSIDSRFWGPVRKEWIIGKVSP